MAEAVEASEARRSNEEADVVILSWCRGAVGR
jgi:hypothetical protein